MRPWLDSLLMQRRPAPGDGRLAQVSPHQVVHPQRERLGQSGGADPQAIALGRLHRRRGTPGDAYDPRVHQGQQLEHPADGRAGDERLEPVGQQGLEVEVGRRGRVPGTR